MTYLLSVVFFGTFVSQFCEDYLLEVAISPKSLYSPSVCTATQANTPDLSGLFGISNTNSFSYGNQQVFKFDYGGHYDQRVVVSQNFTLTRPSYIKAELGVNFLIGDMRVWLVDSHGDIQSGAHRRNLHYLDSILSPGNYTLAIVTGDTQDSSQLDFPPCAVYTLSVEVAPVTSSVHTECLPYRYLPTSLNTPQYLGTSPKV